MIRTRVFNWWVAGIHACILLALTGCGGYKTVRLPNPPPLTTDSLIYWRFGGLMGLLILLFGIFSILAFFRIRKSGKVWMGQKYTFKMELVRGKVALSIARFYLWLGFLTTILGGILIYGCYYAIINRIVAPNWH
jgi:hypothetical protein